MERRDPVPVCAVAVVIWRAGPTRLPGRVGSTGGDGMHFAGMVFERPDKPSLFTSDGVHMNMEGNWIVALEVLRSLKQQEQR